MKKLMIALMATAAVLCVGLLIYGVVGGISEAPQTGAAVYSGNTFPTGMFILIPVLVIAFVAAVFLAKKDMKRQNEKKKQEMEKKNEREHLEVDPDTQ